MLICLACALKGRLIRLHIVTVDFGDGHTTLYTWCRRCNHDGYYPSIAA